MGTQHFGWPFQEGFIEDGEQTLHVFTDYLWNDGSVSRRWHISPSKIDLNLVWRRSFLLEVEKESRLQ